MIAMYTVSALTEHPGVYFSVDQGSVLTRSDVLFPLRGAVDAGKSTVQQ